MDETSYDVRFYRTRVYKGKTVKTYRVRWTVGGQEFTEPFRNNVALADSFRSDLVSAARKGEAFSMETGRPVSWRRAANEMTWYEFACRYVDMKWKAASAKYRRDIARALIAATPAMIAEDKPGKPDDVVIRKVLREWGFNTKQRSNVPDEFASALTWLSRNTVNVSTLTNAGNARRVLDSVISLVNGKPAAASTAKRNRAILCNALDYARELEAIDTVMNPIRALKWTAPKSSSAVDRRSVVNPKQARALLAAVRAQQPSGPRLEAFFGTIYYAGLRPEEAIDLGEENLTFPSPDSDGWEISRLRPPRRMLGARGQITAISATGASLNTARMAKPGSFPCIRNWPRCSALTSRNSARRRKESCSPEYVAGNWPRSSADGHGLPPGNPPSPPNSRSLLSPAASTISGTRPSRPGSTPESHRPR